jgi:hypothetical protein
MQVKRAVEGIFWSERERGAWSEREKSAERYPRGARSCVTALPRHVGPLHIPTIERHVMRNDRALEHRELRALCRFYGILVSPIL